MSFASPEYLPYLLAVVVLFQFVPRPWRVGTLLAASLVLYADWKLAHLTWLLASIAVGHTTALAMHASSTQRRRRAWLALSLTFHLALLCTFKYAGFVTQTVSDVLAWFDLAGPPIVKLALPLGISFYTFQVLSYSFDVYRRRTDPCRNWAEFALFVSFFPQLVAGPIERVEHLVPQLRELQLLSWSNLQRGAVLIAWGLAKKLVFADRLRAALQPMLDAPGGCSSPQMLLAAVGMLAVLYADFSAYTDIARGSASLFGVTLVENFRRPFLATTPLGFWQRWHMSLYTWLIDYVQVPLMRSRPTRAKLMRNSVLVMLLVGLWHGASWNFVLWGLFNGLIVVAFMAFGARLKTPSSAWNRRAQLVGSWMLTMLCGAIVMVLFFTADLTAAMRAIGAMLDSESAAAFAWSLRDTWIALALLAGLALQSVGEFTDLERWWERIGLPGRLAFVAAVAAFTLVWRVPHSSAFIYFQF